MKPIREKFQCMTCGNWNTTIYADRDAVQELICPNCGATMPADEHQRLVYAHLHFRAQKHTMPVVKEGEPYPLHPPFFEDLAAIPTSRDFYIEID